jgi:anthranilate synthase component 1
MAAALVEFQRTTSDVLPSRDEVRRLFAQGDLVPVYRTLIADLETPVSVYLKLARQGVPSFLLESVEGGEQVGRYSFLGVDPRAMLTVQANRVIRTAAGRTTARLLAEDEDPLNAIQQEIAAFTPVPISGLPRFLGGAVGYLGYDVVRYFEELPRTASDDLEVPEAVFMLVDALVIFDHVKHELIILSSAHNEGDPDLAYENARVRVAALVDQLSQPLTHIPHADTPQDDPMQSNVTRERFEENVRTAKEYIAAGDAFQIVLSQRFACRTSAPPFAIYRALRALNPSPYMFFLNFGDDFHLIGASPEMMVRFDEGIATVRPIAGTRKRGETEEEDRALETDLLADPKERAEHVMLVDLGRNDLGRVCEYGTVKVPEMMGVERYSHVMHLVSHIEGKPRPGVDAFDLIRATFPAGTLSGAPKIRAMQIIEELEGTRRGAYGGAVGYFGFNGAMDTCITIRALLMRGDTVYLQAGAGIVADSDPSREYEETINKAKAVSVAIHRAEQGLL